MPTKIRPRSLQRRADRGADLAVARRQLDRLGPAADMHVGARLAGRRHAVDGADRLAVDQDDALVALPHVGQVALDDEGLAEGVLEDLEQRGEILVAAGDPEDAGAAIAVERLDDDVAMLLAEGEDLAAGRG